MCTEIINHKIITFTDSGNGKCKLIYNNPNQITVNKHRVDGCLIKTGSKCDFKLDCTTYEHYIEIKGKDIPYACNQIEETINKLSSDISKCPKKSFVITTGTPTVNGNIQIITKKFKKKYNSSLTVRTRQHTENL